MARNKKYLTIFLFLSVLAHLIFLGHPQETVFDEVHFGKFVSGYFTGEYFFDIHPPLGKLLISAMGFIGGFRPGFSFSNIGEKFSDNSYMWLRMLPALAGIILPIVIYLLALEIGFSRFASFGAGLFILLENSLQTQSLFILLDSFLLFFGFLGLYLYFLARRKKSFAVFIFSSLNLAFAASVKWTGISFLGLVLIIEIVKAVQIKILPKQLLHKLFVFVFLPVAVYFLIFWVHLFLLPKSGPGDAFMPVSFQKSLINNRHKNVGSIKESGIFKKIAELNLEMYKSNRRLSASHPYSSKWYSWPFMTRPVYYWNKVENAKEARIYFFGNPLIYWMSTVGILILLFNLFGSLFKGKRETVFMISGGYLLNFLPFIGIGRVMFLYHYLSALIFAILAFVFLLDRIGNPKKKKTAFAVFLIASLVVFIYFSPLTYGLPLTQEQYNSRVWLPSWR